jgi:glycosyltransferase involved in cell wall biosynthesis
MRILHLCSYYPTTPLYRELVQVLDRRGFEQTVFVPSFDPTHVGRHAPQSLPRGEMIYAVPYRLTDRFFYHRKRKKTLRALREAVVPSDFDLFHAHSLFTNGAVAHELARESGSRFVVAVRGTDIALFYRYALHLRRHAHAILEAAESVVFISPAGRERFLQALREPRIRRMVTAKARVIPNGLDPFWIDNRAPSPRPLQDPARLLYVGRFLPLKRIRALIRAVRLLNRQGVAARLTLIGAGPEHAPVTRAARDEPDLFETRSWLDDRAELLAAYRDADLFVMPSRRETFGLVYLEAMSQGVPIVYGRGTGFDGLFADGVVGYPTGGSARSIAASIERGLAVHGALAEQCLRLAPCFSWDAVADAYSRLYRGETELPEVGWSGGRSVSERNAQ